GASLAFAAPPDVLYAATEINEWAWDAAVADVLGGMAEALPDAARRLGEAVAAERNPALVALVQAAREHHAAALVDDQVASVGLGAGSRSWPVGELPSPALVPWDEVRDVPVVLVTGSNGKTTTTRMLAAIAAAAGYVPGWSCTDGIRVGDDEVESGDWAGPGGARRVLRDRRVEFAVLETARGGILRRGLPVTRATAAVVTNVAEDHFGEYGVSDLEGLAAVKLVVGRAIGSDGRLVLNAEDPALAGAALEPGAPLLWFAESASHPVVAAHLAAGGDAAVVEDGVLTLRRGWAATPVVEMAELPATFGGRLRHNVSNALAAAGAAWAAGVPVAAIARGLHGFRGGAEDNPGRANVFRLGREVAAVVDFAHNPHGVAALADVARLFPGSPRTLLLGQAGDRDDRAIRELARSAWGLHPARVIVKEMANYLRGRAPGELPALLRRELEALGMPAAAILEAGGDVEAARLALELAEPGDLLLLLVHERQAEVLALLGRLERERWRPGTPLPA
ncbi:MAG TPA: Mur ligase family protein, partial [Gemmatimonadales bacterium]|nr:Mur ligase family protein [Gemmatimonadales bacterium]